MESSTQELFTEEQIANNPSVDLRVLSEAERARQELENLGVWKETGSRVRNPFGIKPDMRRHSQKIARLMNQSESS